MARTRSSIAASSDTLRVDTRQVASTARADLAHRSQRRAWFYAAAVIAAGVVLAGCSATPTPVATSLPTRTAAATPEPAATPDAAQIARELEDTNIADAKAAFTNYMAVTTEVEAAGMAEWETRIIPLLGTPEVQAQMEDYYAQAVEQGLRQTGEAALATMTVTEYAADSSGAGFDQVHLDVCIDNTELDLVNPAGESVLLAGFPSRLITVVMMQHQGGGAWTVNEMDTDQDRPC